MSRRHAASDDDASTLTAYLREIAKLPRLTIDQSHNIEAKVEAMTLSVVNLLVTAAGVLYFGL